MQPPLSSIISLAKPRLSQSHMFTGSGGSFLYQQRANMILIAWSKVAVSKYAITEIRIGYIIALCIGDDVKLLITKMYLKLRP